MARAERICKIDNDMQGDNVFDVSRPNTLSNPFTHIKEKKTLAKRVVKTREEAIKLYEEYFDRMIAKEDSDFKKEFDRMYDAYLNNDVIYIKCYCKLTESCHGDYIIKKLRQRLVKTKIEEELNRRKEEEINEEAIR